MNANVAHLAGAIVKKVDYRFHSQRTGVDYSTVLPMEVHSLPLAGCDSVIDTPHGNRAAIRKPCAFCESHSSRLLLVANLIK